MAGATTFFTDESTRSSVPKHDFQSTKKNSSLSWILKIIPTEKLKNFQLLRGKNEPERAEKQTTTRNLDRGIIFGSGQQDDEMHCDNTTSGTCSHEKDIVPLRQFLRYSLNHSDRRAFQRRRITQPFQPKYEIEWQENQWLQLDDSTSKEIERLRKSGFSKVAIRKDANLKKHIVYDNASEIDVLLEVSLLHKPLGKKSTDSESLLSAFHQPIGFCVRRTHWWRESYKVGEARLPNCFEPEPEPELCCNPVKVNNSIDKRQTSGIVNPLPAENNTNIIFPDTPAPSQKSSVDLFCQPPSFWSIKQLQYTEPPSLLKEHALFYAEAKVH